MGSDRSSLALRVPLDLPTYERLAMSARDAGQTLEAHAARLLVGVVGGERWHDPVEIPERRIALEVRGSAAAGGGTAGGGRGEAPELGHDSGAGASMDPALFTPLDVPLPERSKCGAGEPSPEYEVRSGYGG